MLVVEKLMKSDIERTPMTNKWNSRTKVTGATIWKAQWICYLRDQWVSCNEEPGRGNSCWKWISMELLLSCKAVTRNRSLLVHRQMNNELKSKTPEEMTTTCMSHQKWDDSGNSTPTNWCEYTMTMWKTSWSINCQQMLINEERSWRKWRSW